MTESDEFRHYAEEAMLVARLSKTDTERMALINLARTWTQAALHSDAKVHGTGIAAAH
jgi:hypothetical protein